MHAEGYVKNTNDIISKLSVMLKEGKERSPEYAELKRRLGWEINGIILHKYYFENIGGNGILDDNSLLKKAITENFGSYENCKRDFIATGLMRGIGWVVMYYDKNSKKIFNMWINEHDKGNLSGYTPVLVMDVFEHAFITDFGLKKSDYIEIFFQSIKWEEAEKRFKNSLK